MPSKPYRTVLSYICSHVSSCSGRTSFHYPVASQSVYCEPNWESRGFQSAASSHNVHVAYFENVHSKDGTTPTSYFSSIHFIYYDICATAGMTQYHQVPGQMTETRLPNTLPVHLRQGAIMSEGCEGVALGRDATRAGCSPSSPMGNMCYLLCS